MRTLIHTLSFFLLILILSFSSQLRAQEEESFEDLFNFGEEVEEEIIGEDDLDNLFGDDETFGAEESLFGDESDELLVEEGDVVIQMLEKKEIPRNLTLSLTIASPTYVSTDLMTWNSTVDFRFSTEFPLVMFGLIPGFSISDFSFENALPVGGIFEGVALFGTVSRPLFPGKISLGAGIVGSVPGMFIQQAYEFSLWDRVLFAADFRLTWASSMNDGDAVSWFDIGFSPGVILMKRNK